MAKHYEVVSQRGEERAARSRRIERVVVYVLFVAAMVAALFALRLI